jgi:hypothetical protein
MLLNLYIPFPLKMWTPKVNGYGIDYPPGGVQTGAKSSPLRGSKRQ